jgi:hypothetical protein
MSTSEEFPELAKLSSVRTESQAIGEFIEWMGGQGWQFTKYEERTFGEELCLGDGWYGCYGGYRTDVARMVGNKDKLCKRCKGTARVESKTTAHWSDNRTIEQQVADYFDIDLKKVEAERRQLLEQVRALQG